MTRHTSFHLLTAAAVTLLFGAPAQADSMSCHDRIASTGDSLYEVRATCGEPDAANRRIEYRTIRIRGACRGQGERRVCERDIEHTVEIVVDEWIYDFGRNRFIRYLTFEQGCLERIDSGGYGYKPAQ